MNQDTFTRVDDYLVRQLIGDDPILDANLETSQSAGLPDIQVSPLQGKLLQVLAQMTGAQRVLEIGTLGGYSTTWLARGMTDQGKLITLEVSPVHAAAARTNIERAGFAERVEIRVGKALGSLAQLVEEKAAPFDLIFIDADKSSMPEYLEWSIKLSRAGTVIVMDNVVRNGDISNAELTDAGVVGVRSMFEMISQDSRLSATAIQTVGSKGYDGFCLAVVQAAE